MKSQNRSVDNPITEHQCAHGYNDGWCESDNCEHNGTYGSLPYEQAKRIWTELWYKNEYLIFLNNVTYVNHPDGYKCQMAMSRKLFWIPL